MPDSAEVTFEEMANLDSLYEGFPPFAEWNEQLTPATDPWDVLSSAFDQARRDADAQVVEQLLDEMNRSAALNTGALEDLYQVDRGITYTVATRAAAWETALEERGDDIRPFFEAQLEGYEYVLDAATKNRPVTETWIRELHAVITKPQDHYNVLTPQGWQQRPLPKGAYKENPNHVRSHTGRPHAHAPVDRTPEEMHSLVQQLRDSEFEKAHPVVQAAWAHYALVRIHPFADGNGRVARLLASVYLYRGVGIPLVVHADQKTDYLNSLESADNGRPQEWVSFVEARGLDTLQELTLEIRNAGLGPLESSLAAIERRMRGYGELPHAELDSLGTRILGLVHTEVERQLGSLPKPPGVQGFVSAGTSGPVETDDFRSPTHDAMPFIQARLYAPPPVSADVNTSFYVLVAAHRQAPFAFVVKELGTDEALSIRLAEIYPSEQSSLRRKIELWIRGRLATLVGTFQHAAEDSFRKSPYYRDYEP